FHARAEEGVTVLEPGFVVENVSPYTHGLVVSRNEPDLLAAVNDALAKLKADGTIDKLKETWITGE
ncbi:transporter substrate-binding domain-containing protein, partial [Sinorhizobium meliloti]